MNADNSLIWPVWQQQPIFDEVKNEGKCECPLYYDIAALMNGGQPFLRAVPIKKEICAIDSFKRVRL